MFQDEPSVSLNLIADSVLKLSDFYIANPQSGTPWQKEFCQIAYRFYYLPLNYLRCQQVIQRGKDLGFFEELTHFIDWGSGPGTASLAVANTLRQQIKKQFLVDTSSTVLKVFADLHSSLVNPATSTELSFQSYLDQKNRTCAVFSYSMTEIENLPRGWDQFEALMILEPSTSQDGRNLLNFRQQLIEKGYSLWAPCTHQKNCPLLIESKSDWCHDRLHVEAPDWFWQVDQLLPMKNKTVTTSYLLARKKKAKDFSDTIGRLIGDSREEKGKTRQMVCRGEKREFLTWMHKKIQPQVFPRGELVRLPNEIEVKANELRIIDDFNRPEMVRQNP